jgi:hypothetical protein
MRTTVEHTEVFLSKLVIPKYNAASAVKGKVVQFVISPPLCHEHVWWGSRGIAPPLFTSAPYGGE